MGPGRTKSNLSAILAAAAERDEIMVDDPVYAAEALFGLWQGFSNLQLAFDGVSDDARASIADRVDRGTTIFLRAHRGDRR